MQFGNKQKIISMLKDLIYFVTATLSCIHPFLGRKFLRMIGVFSPNRIFVNYLFLLTYTKSFPERLFYNEQAFYSKLSVDPNFLENYYHVNAKRWGVLSEKHLSTIFCFLKGTSLTGSLPARNFFRFLFKDNVLFKRVIDYINVNDDEVQLVVRKICPIKDIADEYIQLSPARDFFFSDPRLSTDMDRIRKQRKVQIQPQYVASLNHVKISEGYRVLKNDFIAEYDISARPDIEFVAGIWQKYIVLKNEEPDICVLSVAKKKKNRVLIDRGILLSGRATLNYFHWLIEYLPRLKNISVDQLKDHHLIIGKKMPRSFHDSLSIVAPDVPFIEVDPAEEEIHVNHLLVPSFHTYHPDDFNSEYWIGGGISYDHLDYLRSRVFAVVPKKSHNLKRIFLSRKGGRNIVNIDEVSDVLMQYGFQFLSPENYSFEEQVQIFQDAEVIVGPAGAAFSNLIFCGTGTKVAICLAERNSDFVMQANLGVFAGCDVVHAIGINEFPRSHYITEEQFVHSSYSLPVSEIERIFSSWGLVKMLC